MPHTFAQGDVDGVLRHMNRDHLADSVLIVRAFGRPDAVEARMTGFDGEGGDWDVVGEDGAASSLRVAWPGGAISERAEVRREVVALHRLATPTA